MRPRQRNTNIKKKIYYRFDDIIVVLSGENQGWWGRSVASYDAGGWFCRGDTNGHTDVVGARPVLGFAPAF